jgi:hypothetical protein
MQCVVFCSARMLMLTGTVVPAELFGAAGVDLARPVIAY